MNVKFDFPIQFSDRTVYVRPVDRDNLPEDVRAHVTPGKPVYGIHAADGQCLALAKDRNVAFAIARGNEMAPVSVH